MKTYVVTVIDTFNPFVQHRTTDIVIFSDVLQAYNFQHNEPAYDYLDESVPRLEDWEKILGSFCILAENLPDAIHRAWKLQERFTV